jgi:hypothetical protein
MITATGTVRGDHGVPHGLTTGRCTACGEDQAFLDLTARDSVSHVCGTAVMGGTWWVTKAAPGRVRRRRAAA